MESHHFAEIGANVGLHEASDARQSRREHADRGKRTEMGHKGRARTRLAQSEPRRLEREYDRPDGITSQSRHTSFRPSNCPNDPDQLRLVHSSAAGPAPTNQTIAVPNQRVRTLPCTIAASPRQPVTPSIRQEHFMSTSEVTVSVEFQWQVSAPCAGTSRVV